MSRSAPDNIVDLRSVYIFSVLDEILLVKSRSNIQGINTVVEPDTNGIYAEQELEY